MADEETTPILLVFVGSRIDSNGTGLDDYWLLVTPDEFESGIAPENKYRSYGKLAKKRIGGTPGTARRHVHNRSLEPPPRRTQDTRLTRKASMTLQRIQELRTELEAERISYGELHEIDCAADEAGITVTDEMLAGDILDELEALAK